MFRTSIRTTVNHLAGLPGPLSAARVQQAAQLIAMARIAGLKGISDAALMRADGHLEHASNAASEAGREQALRSALTELMAAVPGTPNGTLLPAAWLARIERWMRAHSRRTATDWNRVNKITFAAAAMTIMAELMNDARVSADLRIAGRWIGATGTNWTRPCEVGARKAAQRLATVAATLAAAAGGTALPATPPSLLPARPRKPGAFSPAKFPRLPEAPKQPSQNTRRDRTP